MDYWVYENWTHKKAIIHEETCSYCNAGQGIHGGAPGRNGQWHGPISTYADAKASAKRTGQAEIRRCKTCSPN